MMGIKAYQLSFNIYSCNN